jgi:glycosyltransferase involved in cell wall biosynthesis
LAPLSQDSRPRVSIITATYNRSDVLCCAIECVLHQTVDDWEHIIVGDACTDDTAEVVASFADPRIRFVNRKTNYGEQSRPNNEGFALSSGDLIAYLNHDDLWFPDHLETLTKYIEETGADLVHTLPFSIDQNGLSFLGATNSELRYDPSQFLVSSLWLARRELIEELEGWRSALETHAVSPSQDLLTRAWQRGRDIRCSPRVTALFLPSGGRPSSYKERDNRQHVALLAQLGQPGFREGLLTAHAVQSAQTIDDLRFQVSGVKQRFNARVDRLLTKLHIRPEALRHRLARRRKGDWVDYIRVVRGLPPLERDEPK